MLRRAATRSTLYRPSFAPAVVHARSYAVLESGGKLGEREKAVEDRAIRSHDLELLKKLRDSLGIQVRNPPPHWGACCSRSPRRLTCALALDLQENQPIPETVVSQVSSPNINPFAQRSQQSSQSTSSSSSSNHHNDEALTR
jgi:hypothetical protein